MARVDVRPGRRARDRRAVPLLVIGLAVGLTVTATPGWATAAPAVARAASPAPEPAEEPGGDPPTADPTEPGPVPTEAPSTTAPPPESPPPPATTEPAPTTAAPEQPLPTTAAPTTGAPPPAPSVPPVRPSAPAPTQPAPAAGVSVTTDDVTLAAGYWNAPSTVTTLRVTITNTGATPARIRLAYTLPAGLTDAGTGGCAPVAGGEHRCGEWASAPGARFSTLLRVRVDGDAWKRMPLSGSVRVIATTPGVAGTVGDDEGFAVLFPPGPPVPGIRLDAGAVSFDISGGSSGLDVRLGNTGRVDAEGRVEVVLPAGVTVPAPPAGCTTVDPTRTRCELGALAAGRTAQLRLPVSATAEAQRQAPLAGAVLGQLDPRSGRAKKVQMSFRITAAAALATPVASPPAPTGSQGVLAADVPAVSDGGGGGSVRRTAILLIVISTLLVVFALALATTSLRRRMAAPAAGPSTAPTE
ncbi:hypothetical protein GA0070610_4928 [Micromonospora echinofusca]|uniref:Uncharacterized protein n=1 Tax=Micromonospora echinofusca TaxID=47858 RepID=A0A1C5GG81_MICEH|nr:hypothetical protein [Micromonospora echinofusca]SCG18582.1 hypothetical protein GA0070610_4928 [Micromonospora echinofusca]